MSFLTRAASGGVVGGASNLSTAGGIAYVASAGVLGINASQLFWDAANSRLGVGTNVPPTELTVRSNSTATPRGIMSWQYSADAVGARMHFRKDRNGGAVLTADVLGRMRASGYDGSSYLEMASIDMVASGTVASTRVPTDLVFSVATDAAPSVLTERLRLTNAGVLRLNGTAQVGPGNSSGTGTMHIYDATATTGVTTCVVRAGAGQGSTQLQQWAIANGTVFAYVDALNQSVNSGQFRIGTAAGGIWSSAGNVYPSNASLLWSTTTNAATGVWDLGLVRDAAGRLRVSNGSTGLGQIMIASSTPASAADTGAAGTIVWDANYIYVCTATNTWKRVAIATW